MSVLLGEPQRYGGFARTPEPGGAGFVGRAREAASFARRENPIQFGSNLLDNEIFDEEIAAIERDTGVKIPHPVLGRFDDAEDEIRERARVLRNQGFRGENVQMARREVQRRRYSEEIAALKRRFPDAPAFRPENSFEERRKRRAATFEAKAQEGGFLANLAGGVIAAPSDPLNVVTAPIGFTSKTVLGAFAKNAAANAGIQAAAEPLTQERRGELGLDASFEQGAINVAAAGVFGGGLGAGGKLLADALKGGRPALADLGRVQDDPELRAGAYEIDRELEVEADVETASGGPLEPLARVSALDRLNAAERVIDAAEAGDRPSRRDIAALTGEGPPIDARPIRQDVAITPRGREVPVTYAIADLDDLTASHDASLARNPKFPAELQPRDRGRAASAAQIADIAANLDPRLLDRTPSAGDGAPVIRGDGAVISGNGRVLAIARAYDRGFESADRYRAYLEAEGYPVGETARPVLVRIAEATEDLQGFAREANERSVAAMSAPEQARADAANLKPADFNLLDGPDPSAAKNARFIRAVVAAIAPEAERGALMDAKGALSAEGTRRVRNAIAAYAYDDAALIDNLIEAEGELKSLGQALMDAAPDFARLKSEIEAGAVDPRTDIRAHVGEAAAIVAQARRSGRNVAEFVGQEDMFSGAVDARTVAILRLFFRNEDFTAPRARGRIAEELAFYAREARKADAAPALFGEESDPATRILDAVRQRADGDDPDAPGLFGPRGDAGAPSLLPEPDTGSRASPQAGAGEGAVTPGAAIEDFSDPLSSAAKKARADEVAEALAELDPDPETRAVTGDLDIDADGNVSARTQSRAELDAEFAADQAIVERLKGCVT